MITEKEMHQLLKESAENKRKEQKDNNVAENSLGDLVNAEFAQFYDNSLYNILCLADKSLPAFKVLIFLIKNMSKNNTIMVEYKVLMDVLHYKSDKSIKNAISVLREENFIYTYKFQKMNVYFINPAVSCRVDAEYKLSLAKEYCNRAGTIKLGYVDKDIIDSSFYDKEDKATLHLRFNKQHEELRNPNELTEEEQKQQDEYIKTTLEEENKKNEKKPKRIKELPPIDETELLPPEETDEPFN